MSEGKFSLEKLRPFKTVLIMVVLASLLLSGHAPKPLPAPTLTNSVSIPPPGAVNPTPFKSIYTHYRLTNSPTVPGYSASSSVVKFLKTANFRGGGESNP